MIHEAPRGFRFDPELIEEINQTLTGRLPDNTKLRDLYYWDFANSNPPKVYVDYLHTSRKPHCQIIYTGVSIAYRRTSLHELSEIRARNCRQLQTIRGLGPQRAFLLEELFKPTS